MKLLKRVRWFNFGEDVIKFIVRLSGTAAIIQPIYVFKASSVKQHFDIAIRFRQNSMRIKYQQKIAYLN